MVQRALIRAQHLCCLIGMLVHARLDSAVVYVSLIWMSARRRRACTVDLALKGWTRTLARVLLATLILLWELVSHSSMSVAQTPV